MSMFTKFKEEQLIPISLEPFRTEWRICDPIISVGGSVDFVGILPDGTYAIIDWKRSKNMEKTSAFNNKMKPPLNHLDDTSVIRYFLQMNIYRHILQKHYNIKVSQMILASFHPKQNNYIKLDAPFMDKEVKNIFELFECISSRG